MPLGTIREHRYGEIRDVGVGTEVVFAANYVPKGAVLEKIEYRLEVMTAKSETLLVDEEHRCGIYGWWLPNDETSQIDEIEGLGNIKKHYDKLVVKVTDANFLTKGSAWPTGDELYKGGEEDTRLFKQMGRISQRAFSDQANPPMFFDRELKFSLSRNTVRPLNTSGAYKGWVVLEGECAGGFSASTNGTLAWVVVNQANFSDGDWDSWDHQMSSTKKFQEEDWKRPEYNRLTGQLEYTSTPYEILRKMEIWESTGARQMNQKKLDMRWEMDYMWPRNVGQAVMGQE